MYGGIDGVPAMIDMIAWVIVLQNTQEKKQYICICDIRSLYTRIYICVCIIVAKLNLHKVQMAPCQLYDIIYSIYVYILRTVPCEPVCTIDTNF